MKKNLFAVLSVVILASLILSACGGAAAPTPAPVAQPTQAPATKPTDAPAAKPTDAAAAKPTEPPAAAGPSGTLTLWHAYQTGSAEEATLTTLIANAKTAFPKLTINVLQIPFDQIFNKWQVEIAAGGGPDMFVAPNDDLGNWARGKLVDNLDTALKGKLDKVVPVGVDGMKVDGVMYGVPESAKAVALYYNKSMVDTPPATTDELLAAVKGGKKMTFFIGAYHMFGWAGSFGGKLMDDNAKCIADQGGWEQALQYLLDLKAAGAKFDSDYGVAETPFRKGETAFFVNGPWALADYKKDLGDKLGVALLPKGTADAKPLNGIDGFYLNPNSKNKDAALQLALFLTNKDSSQIYTDKAGHVPIRTDVTASDPLVQTFAKASAQGYPRPQSKEFANYWTPFGDMFTKVIEGVQKPKEAVAAACKAMNDANKK